MSLITATTAAGELLPAIVTPDGVTRFLGAITSGNAKMAAPAYAASNPVIPRSDWKAIKRPRGPVPIMNQGNHGSCVGHGSCRALMKARDAAGMQFVLLSPTYIYAQINGGRDGGADLADAATCLQTIGTCTMQEVGETTIFKRQIPASADQTAKRFVTLKLFQCNSFDEEVSAWLVGFTLFDSIRCGANFNNLDSDGVPGVSFGPGNHCVSVADELKQTSRGDWLLDHANSWDTNWGQGGYFFSGERAIDRQPGWQCFALQAVATDPQDPTDVPSA
jgi:C1A family cysteine protease